MKKTEFLQELKEALEGEVNTAGIQENIRYYDQYITQECQKGRTEQEVIEEIGSPRLIAKTIIDSYEAAGGSQGRAGYTEDPYRKQETYENTQTSYHQINLNKWYWKIIIPVVIFLVLFLVMTVVGGIFSLLFRFAGPILVVWLVYSLIKSLK